MNRSLTYLHSSWRVRAVILAVTACMVGGAKSASAQNPFTVVGDSTPFDVSINGATVTTANVSGYLHTGTGSKNTLTVGWDPPTKGNYIELKYTGTGSFNLGSVTVTTGDYLHVYGLTGVYLTTSTSTIGASSSGSTLTTWNNATAASGWGFSTQSVSSNGTSYSDVGYSTNSTNFIGYTNTGSVNGKSFTGAAQYGAFSFNGLNFGSATAEFLGLDIYAQVYNTADSAAVSNSAFGSGYVSLGSIAPHTVAPEGSSLALIAVGLLPLAWQGRRLLKRGTSPQ